MPGPVSEHVQKSPRCGTGEEAQGWEEHEEQETREGEDTTPER